MSEFSPATGARRPAVLLAIIAWKFAKSAAFLAAGAMLAIYRQGAATGALIHAANWADGDPRLHLTAKILRQISTDFELHFSGILAACLIAGVVLGAEGVFLSLGYTWAPWLTIFLTGVWLPIELFRLVAHFSIRTLVVFIINAVVVVYLYFHRHEFTRHFRGSKI